MIPQLLLLVVALAHAFPTGKYFYQRPGPNDARSPCPGLNTLANHGYLNRDGRNIRGDDIINAALQVYNIAPRWVLFFFLSSLSHFRQHHRDCCPERAGNALVVCLL